MSLAQFQDWTHFHSLDSVPFKQLKCEIKDFIQTMKKNVQPHKKINVFFLLLKKNFFKYSEQLNLYYYSHAYFVMFL